MAMETEHFDGDSTESVLGKVLTPASRTDPNSMYVRVPTIDEDRRTDGGARDMNATSVEFIGGIESYERGEYITLTFKPKEWGDNYVLTSVEHAEFTDPTNVDEPTFPNTEIPKTCPQCGRKAAAVVKTEYDSMTGGKVSETADGCVVEEDNRGSWLGLSREHTFIHGVEE